MRTTQSGERIKKRVAARAASGRRHYGSPLQLTEKHGVATDWTLEGKPRRCPDESRSE